MLELSAISLACSPKIWDDDEGGERGDEEDD
jgi:hypothetical protein